MLSHRQIAHVALLSFAASALASAGQAPKSSARQPGQPAAPALSAQEIFKRVSPSIMVVESLGAKGSVAAFGSGVVIKCGSPLDIFDRLAAKKKGVTLSPSYCEGFVITNRHVIENGVSYKVEHAGKKWPAKLIRVDPDHDLAELSVDGLNAPAVTVRDSSKLAVGEKVYAIGAPEGLELTISEGLISGLRDFDKDRVIQTSAAISPGSSGGGLFDAQGRLVGITTFYLKEGQSLNFALPAEWTLALDCQPASAEPAAAQDSATFQALVWNEAGYKAHQGGKYDQAVSAFQEAIRLKPEFAEAWNNLGVAYGSLGQYDDAIRSLREVIRLKPDLADAWYDLGNIYGHLGKYQQDISAQQQAIRLKPDLAEAWNDLGVAYGSLGQYDQEVSAEQQAIQLKPDFAEAWNELGTAYDGLGQHDKAASALQEAIHLNSGLSVAWYNLGLTYKEQGLQSEVIKVYEKLKTLDAKLAEEFFQQALLP